MTLYSQEALANFSTRLVVFFIHSELTVIVSEIADSASSADGAYSTEDLSKVAAQQNEMSSPQQSPSNSQSQSQG